MTSAALSDPHGTRYPTFAGGNAAAAAPVAARLDAPFDAPLDDPFDDTARPPPRPPSPPPPPLLPLLPALVSRGGVLSRGGSFVSVHGNSSPATTVVFTTLARSVVTTPTSNASGRLHAVMS